MQNLKLVLDGMGDYVLFELDSDDESSNDKSDKKNLCSDSESA